MAQTTLNNGDTGLVARGAINDNFTEVYRRGSINVAEYGAIGDGETDDTTALQNAFDAANAANKNIELEENKTYIVTNDGILFYGNLLDGRGSTIKVTETEEAISTGIRCDGSVGGYVSIDEDAFKGNNYIYVSDAGFLSSVSIGDMVSIRSSALYYDSPDTIQGELNVIIDVGVDYVKLGSLLNDTYLTSDDSEIAIVSSRRPIIKNLKIQQNESKGDRSFQYGILMTWCLKPYIENCEIINCYTAAFSVALSYSVTVNNVTTYGTEKEGGGYGVEIAACTNYTVKDCKLFGARHAVSHNGSVNYGVCYNGFINNVIGESIVNSHVFDVHEEAAHVVFNNCTAIGGKDVSQESDYQGVWDSETEYTLTQVVSKDNVLWDCNVATSTGNDPTTSTDWAYHNNIAAGFAIRANDMHIINCRSYGCYIGLWAQGYTSARKRLNVDSFHAYDCGGGGISITQSTSLEDCHFNKISVFNKYYKSTSYIIEIHTATFNNVDFGSLEGKNTRGIKLRSLTGDLYIDKLKCYDAALLMDGDSADTNIVINDLKFIGGGAEYAFFLRNINSVKINGVYGDSVNVRFAYILSGRTVGSILIGNAQFNSGSGINIFDIYGTLTQCHVGTCAGDINNVFGTGSPGTEIVQGNFDDPNIIRGAGSPEGSVIGNIGTMYQRTDGGANTTLYIKESGSGNTGWVAK